LELQRYRLVEVSKIPLLDLIERMTGGLGVCVLVYALWADGQADGCASTHSWKDTRHRL